MRSWAWLWVFALGACRVGPSEQDFRCFQACARDKDACMLAASTGEQIQSCDARSSRCTRSCE